MNIQFFQAAMVVYLLAAAGYIAYIIAPEKKNRAVFSLVATVAGFLLHTAYFILRWSESSRIPITGFFEAINFLGMGIVLVFLIMEARYRIATWFVYASPRCPADGTSFSSFGKDR